MRKQTKRILAAILTLVLVISSFEFSPGKVAYATAEEVSTANPKVIRTITEKDLEEEGVTGWSSATKATLYVKITEGDSNSLLNATLALGPDSIGKTSSKYLVGRDNDSGKTGNAIQDNIVGAVGTGIYKFQDLSLNKTCKDTSVAFEDSYSDYVTICIRAMSENTNCEVVGIKFNNGVTYPKGFSEPKCENTTLDAKEVSARDSLEKTLQFCETMDQSKYKADSYAAFKSQLDKAKATYDDKTTINTEVKEVLAALEKAKANLQFVDATEESNPLEFRELSGDDTVYEMGAGINLGNTMDGHSGFTPAETCWQGVVTTKEYIKTLHDAGYNTVRIPVTWGTMIDEKNGFSINESWMSRVQDIVDYCMSLDMYAIINIHHDGAEQTGWLRVASDDIDSVYNEFECVWRTIATKFKDYDEHLIFESMNEISCMDGDLKNSQEAVDKDTPIINNLNQIFVNVVRSTGSNNTKRWLAAVAHYANSGNHKEFVLPTDSYNDTNRLMFGAHIYKSSTNTTWTYSQVYEVVNGLKNMAKKFNVPMYLGEYGNRNYVQSGTETGYNDVARAYFCEIVQRACQVAKVVPVVWDQGHDLSKPVEKQTGVFTYWDRQNLKPVFKTITDAMMRGTMLPATDKNKSYDFTDIKEGVTVKEITELSLEKEEATITVGDTKVVNTTVVPEDTNDVVLWSSDNENVATVYRGSIRAKGIGTTTIHAYSQSGSVSKVIQVTVKAKQSDIKTTITTSQDEYSVQNGGNSNIVATSSEPLTYTSSNEEIVTVNQFGKLVGKKVGSAYVTIKAASGATKMVKVTVTSAIKSSIDVALNVLYNDNNLKYYGTEIGDKITLNGDGQYTVDFDLSKDLSDNGKKAGVTKIANLTAIYIKDYDVAIGNVTQTSVKSAKIRYDKVVVNGQELTITDSSFNSALTSAGVFDSGKPVNAWDGSVVKEATSSNHVANFVGIDKPTTVSVTFTIEGMEFETEKADKENEAVDVTAVSSQNIVIEHLNDSSTLKVKMNPIDTDSYMTFSSSDESVAMVSGLAIKPDENGEVEVKVLAAGVGKATITGKTENDKTVTFEVIVGVSSIRYEVNGGTNNDDAVYSVQGEETVSLLAPSRKGYTFAGWYQEATFARKVSELKATGEEIIVYAKWITNNNAISYQLNGGANNKNNPTTVTTGKTVTLQAPSRKGYTFAGWYKESTFKTKVTKVTGTGDKIKVYAKWTANTNAITYKLNGGTNSKNNPSTVTTGKKVTLQAPSRKGYTFAGWYKESTFKTKVTKVTGTGDKVIVYAKWNKNTYKITYKLNKGTNNKSNPKTYTVTSKTITLKNPTRANYVFAGWYKDSKFKNKVTKIKAQSTGNITLYAKWTKVSVKKASITSTSRSNTTITLKWKKNSLEKGYVIKYSTNKNFKNSKKITTTSSSKKITKLKRRTTYYVKVQAYKLDSKGKKVYGSFSKVKTIKTK